MAKLADKIVKMEINNSEKRFHSGGLWATNFKPFTGFGCSILFYFTFFLRQSFKNLFYKWFDCIK